MMIRDDLVIIHVFCYLQLIRVAFCVNMLYTVSLLPL